MRNISKQDFLDLLKNRGSRLTILNALCDEFGVPEQVYPVFVEGKAFDFRGNEQEGDAAEAALKVIAGSGLFLTQDITITSAHDDDGDVTGEYRLNLTDHKRTVISISDPDVPGAAGHSDIAFYGNVTVMNAAPGNRLRVIDATGQAITISSDELVDLKAVGHPIALTDCATPATKLAFDNLKLPISAALLVQDFGDLISEKVGIDYYSEEYNSTDPFDCDIVFDSQKERFALVAPGSGNTLAQQLPYTVIASCVAIYTPDDIEILIECYINEN